jgi:hypothetical protein
MLHNLKQSALDCKDELGIYPMGQLEEKVEAAGKIRVFAMVDY